MRSNTRYGKAALISAILVGGGQIYARRVWSGIALATLFYGSIAVMAIIWTGINQAFWALLAAWVLFWAYNIIDAYKGFRYQTPPCEKACPAGISPWTYVNMICHESKEQYPYVPFFGTLEHICPAPCENDCTRRGIDAAVAIKYLKRCVPMEKPAMAKKSRKEKVAVVGAGPCGLTAACYLAGRGYRVAVYEREAKPGGVLTTLIPRFRLPDAMLEAEIEAALAPGVELKCGIEIGKNLKLEELLEKYDAVFIAIGAWRATSLGIAGEDKALSGFDILRRIKDGEKFELGKVGVIGGGNTAIDVARSLRRQGNDVKIYYRRRIMDMPAEHEDRIEAMEEGIEIVELVTPVEIRPDRLKLIRTECTEGRAGALSIIKDSEFDVSLDAVVITAGQWPDSSFLADHVRMDKRGRILAKNGRTSNARVFAGGDAVLGSATVAHAVGQGLSVAEEIDRRLRRVPRFWHWLTRRDFTPDVKQIPMHTDKKIEIPHRPATERIRDFNEVELKAPAEELKKEACRCLSCPIKYHP